MIYYSRLSSTAVIDHFSANKAVHLSHVDSFTNGVSNFVFVSPSRILPEKKYI